MLVHIQTAWHCAQKMATFITTAVRTSNRTSFIHVCFYATVLDVEAFERLLGPCMNIMKRNIDDYEDQLVRIFGSKTNITDIR
jgi:hypothetical protein